MNIIEFSDEVLCYILRHLPIDTLSMTVPLICKRFNGISKDDYMWQLICNYDCGIMSKGLGDLTWKDTLFRNYCKHLLSVDYARLRKVYTFEHKKKMSISLCQENINCTDKTKDIWTCLTCDYTGCSRYINKHALDHTKETGHPINCKYDGLNYWCYYCMRYVGELNGKEKVHLKVLAEIMGFRESEKHSILMSSLKLS